MTSTLRPLLLPIRPTVLLKYLGQLALPLSVLLAVPVAVALLCGEEAFALRLTLGALLPTALLSLAGRLPSPTAPIQPNEALALSAISFLLAPLSLVYPLSAQGIAPLDALFEAVSGVTTTGLTTLGSLQGLDPALLFTRAWLQWFGGLGVVVLTLALLAGPGPETRRLAGATWEEDDLAGSTRAHARRVLTVYATLTAAGVLLLAALGLSPFEALLHTLTAVSTGGFSPFDASLGGMTPRAVSGVMVLMFCGALPLTLLHPSPGWAPWRNVEFRALAVASLGVAALLWWCSDLTPFAALFQAISAQTGTGFSTVSIAALPADAKGVLILSMFIGAGVGSTAGGIKLLRLLILLRMFQLMLLRTRLPRHTVLPPSVGGHRLEETQITRALLIIALFAVLVFLSWLPFLAAGLPPLDALFEVVSATATVGLSTGISAPDLDPLLKGVLIFDMLAGRVEILALLVLLAPGSWIRPGQ
ncbi:TrkH family potassium uptake protein [Endothiovibrio diazotrophicus]